MNHLDYKRLIEVIIELIDDLKGLDFSLHLNERYLHHIFSHKIQLAGCSVSLSERYGIHPEWATYIKGKREYSLYKGNKQKEEKNNNKCHYNVVEIGECVEEKGSSGFIDFAIGDAEKPDYAIEFKMDDKFDESGIIYDYMKLLDARNPIGKSVSISVFYHSKRISTKMNEITLNGYLENARDCLSNSHYSKDRKRLFIVLEVVDNKPESLIRNCFICNNSCKFDKIDYKDLSTILQ